jgi:hypothetical protein
MRGHRGTQPSSAARCYPPGLLRVEVGVRVGVGHAGLPMIGVMQVGDGVGVVGGGCVVDDVTGGGGVVVVGPVVRVGVGVLVGVGVVGVGTGAVSAPPAMSCLVAIGMLGLPVR